MQRYNNVRLAVLGRRGRGSGFGCVPAERWAIAMWAASGWTGPGTGPPAHPSWSGRSGEKGLASSLRGGSSHCTVAAAITVTICLDFRLIRAGSRIILENPLVVVNQSHDTTVVEVTEVLQQFLKLSEKDRQKYLSLYFTSDVSPEMVSLDTGESLAAEVDLPVTKIGQIFMANSVGLRKVGDMDRCGVFPQFSRINHSCNPNSQVSCMFANILSQLVSVRAA